MKSLYDNPLANAWKKRYSEQPIEIQRLLDELAEKKINDYQLKVIKKQRKYPEIGDVFWINPKDNIFFKGVVINNHVSNINGEELLIIMIFNEVFDSMLDKNKDFDFNRLLIEPSIVGKEYWNRGLFYIFDNIELPLLKDKYGFYAIGKDIYLDEYGNELQRIPKQIGMYGVSTISGIAYKINRELIIQKILL